MPSLTIALLSVVLGVVVANSLPGGWSEMDLNSPTVRNLASIAVDRYNMQSNALFYKKHTEIASARSQVVAGINYEIEILIAETECTKSQDPDSLRLSQCNVKQNSNVEKCVCQIFQPLGPQLPEVTSMPCTKVQSNN